MAKVRSIGVFCGSKHGKRKSYGDTARRAGEAIAEEGARLVYGGGDVGLMGECARAAANAGGLVRGIIPDFLIAREGRLNGVEIVIVDTMSTRKKRLIAASDAYLILPGGTGTLEEVYDVISRQQLGLHDKPIAFVNTDNFWQPFFALMDHCVAEGFAPGSLAKHFIVETEPEAAIEKLMDALAAKEAA